MKIIRSVVAIKKEINALRLKSKSIGFVPTMGYFHEGHLKLMREAKKSNDICVVSLFVNPTQFAVNEDLSQYPRDLKRDTTMARKENVDILFIPSDNEIYQQGYLTYVDVLNVSQGLCGQYRPGHFRGVATIVLKLLNIVQPTIMYLGAKDAQQVVVLSTMVRDLNVPVKIKVVQTIREADGLAMSSRNKYLNPEERIAARVLNQSLLQAKRLVNEGERSAKVVLAHMTRIINSSPLAKVQYVTCVNALNLKPLNRLEGDVLIALAVYIGKTRLIDNMTIRL